MTTAVDRRAAIEVAPLTRDPPMLLVVAVVPLRVRIAAAAAPLGVGHVEVADAAEGAVRVFRCARSSACSS